MSKSDLAEKAEELAKSSSVVDGVDLVATLHDADADSLRELAQAVANKLGPSGDSGVAVVLGSSQDGKALLVAACSKSLVAKGVTAPKLLEQAAGMLGGGAGGKPTLGFAGGKNADAVKPAVQSIPARLAELLDGGA